MLTYANVWHLLCGSGLALAHREPHALLMLFLLYYRLSLPHSLYLLLLCFSCFTTGSLSLSLSLSLYRYIPAPPSASRAPHLLRAARGVCVRSVSICTFVPVKQVKLKKKSSSSCAGSVRAQRQYLCVCTSKASKTKKKIFFALRGECACAASVFARLYQ
jgi:hypothetical protein